ncbi:MAG: ion transporter [Fibrobacteres bacterium]|nr:ion transporter [Fibrobacterota bacterium]
MNTEIHPHVKPRTPQKPAPEEFKDLGFGTRLAAQDARLLNRDGSFNVERRGLPPLFALNIYQELIKQTWPRFILTVLCFYVAVNMLFSLLYMAIGVRHLAGLDTSSVSNRFWDAFFFSAQTLTTVGYGRISPVGFITSMTAAFESLAGLMGFALATGLLYARFSRPQARMLFSKNALISPYRGGTALMFRVANGRRNEMIETEIQVALSLPAPDGKRRFYDLPLERRSINFFPLSWTVVHPIDAESPLYGMGAEHFKDAGEIFIQMKSFDDVFSQTLYIRSSYRFEDIVYGASFTFIFGRNERGATTIDLHRLDEHEPAELPLLDPAETRPEAREPA